VRSVGADDATSHASHSEAATEAQDEYLLLLVLGKVIPDIRVMARDEPEIPQDPTPIVAAPTDIAPLSHLQPKPAHERTAEEEAGVIDWEKLAASERFRSLLKAKRRFIIPAMIFFIVYYFALPVLIGYARPFMETRVWGPVNLAYLFALSQFFMAWIIAALYVRAAARFDKMAAGVIKPGDASK
jgi:uncharacterized membrane protein (DUF485 family)